MDDNEIRLVHREETFNDLAVRELARGRSACVCRIQFGSCSKDDCKNCSIGKQYSHCYNQMNDYDKARLAKYVSENYVHDSLYPGKWMSYKGLCKHTARWFIIIIICMALLFIPLCLLGPGDKPNITNVSDKTNEHIIVTEMLTQKNIKDVNYDNKINCIDYACTFKLIWDAIYDSEDCIIIRNKSLLLHHLFIGIYDDKNLIFVEPWATDPYKYLMSENWFGKWNPRFNIYDETDKWLSEVKK